MTKYVVVGECVVLVSLLVTPAGSKRAVPASVAGLAVIISVLFWPVVLASWFRRVR